MPNCLNVLTFSAVLFHYIYIHLDNYLTGAEFHTMLYQYLIQVSLVKYKVYCVDHE